MIQIANPIYDSVFKYMMQNNKVCKILLSALLDRDIIEVKVLNNEIIRADLRKFAVLRLDFLAKIKNPDDSIETVSIELQKAVKSTEIVRFRNYLAKLYDTQANDTEVIISKNRKGETVRTEKKTPYHIIAIYILGHALDGIDEPVIYNYSHPVDVLGNPIKNAQSNLFFNSLTHDTVIVQIPRLRKNVKSRVEEFLEIFDQSRTMPGNTHYLLLDNEENKPAGYETVVRQLAGAAADKETKKVMDIEDEYAADIEDRIELEDIVQEQKEQLSQQKEQIEQQNNQLASLAKMLMSMGWSEKKIAEKTNMSIEQVKDIVN